MISSNDISKSYIQILTRILKAIDNIRNVAPMGSFFVYIVRCERDNSFYTGYTSNLERRISQHNKGIGSKYTQSHGPVELLYYETFRTRRTAMQREQEIKRFSRKKKFNLIKNKVEEEVKPYIK